MAVPVASGGMLEAGGVLLGSMCGQVTGDEEQAKAQSRDRK